MEGKCSAPGLLSDSTAARFSEMAWPSRGSRSPRHLYQDAVRYFRDERWTRPRLLSKRLRLVIRLIALEERCQALGVGALPPRIMATLRLLSDYQEAGRKRYYQSRTRRATLPPEEKSP